MANYVVCEGSVKGDIYLGPKVENKRQGLGIFVQPSKGKIYEGQFCDDLADGIGYKTCSKNRSYMGQYLKGRKEGVGKLKEGNTCFIGQFEKGSRHGVGIMKELGGYKTIKG